MRKQAVKSALEKHPILFRTARAGYLAAALSWNELTTLARIGPSLLTRSLFRRKSLWRQELPVQRSQSFRFSWPSDVRSPAELMDHLKTKSVELQSGRHSIYLGPIQWADSPFADLRHLYPAQCGLKISRESGGVDNPYAIDRPGHNVQRRYSLTHRQQALTFNLLHLKGIAPRLYDVIELVDQHGARWAAYVVEHVSGSAPGEIEYEGMLARLQSLEQEGLIRLVTPGGWQGTDFRKFDCNGNLLVLPTGEQRYIDVHSFVLDQYEKHLGRLADEASAASHFGSKSFVLGGKSGRYLYQEIPGVPRAAKRSPQDRMRVWDRLFEAARFSFDNKVIFDIGCNLGLMSAEYLRRGARWIHGWDMPSMIAQTQRVLRSIGCTRFSLTPGQLSSSRDLVADLPIHLKSIDPENGVVNYLAMRRHIGWLEGLRDLAWRHMLYEGHEGDEPFEVYFARLKQVVNVRVLGEAAVTDANSRDRHIALIERVG